VSTVGSLGFAGSPGAWTGTLDLNNNDLIIMYGSGTSPLATIQGFIEQAYDGGLWGRPGLTSSVAAANSSTFGLGYAEASTLGVSTFDGVTLGGNAVLVKYTLLGDANLDGTVNFNDFSIVQTHYGQPGDWADGDFNYDGTVNFNDFSLLQNNYGKTMGTSPEITPTATENTSVSKPTTTSTVAPTTTALSVTTSPVTTVAKSAATNGSPTKVTSPTLPTATATVTPAKATRQPTTVILSRPPASITADGNADVIKWVKATVKRAGGAEIAASPIYIYYLGRSVTGKPLKAAPTAAGTYTVVATYSGSKSYLPSSASVTFTIAPEKKTTKSAMQQLREKA
jgi:hypothetical protein